MTVNAEIRTITPELANEWLAHNNVNRNLRRGVVDSYARDMKAGSWLITGEAIKISAKGQLLDGQHRATAVIKAGVPVQMMVVTGLPEATQAVMDSGSKRGAGDALTLSGFRYSDAVAAAVRILLEWVDGRTHYAAKNATNTEIVQWALQYQDELEGAAEIAHRYYRKTDVSPSMALAAAFIIGTEAGIDEAEIFWMAAAEKIGLSAGDPVLAMTAWFAEQKRNRVRTPNEIALSVILRAFNLRAQGKPLTKIVTHQSGRVVPVPKVLVRPKRQAGQTALQVVEA